MTESSSQFYINKNISYLINKRIYEYDISKAGITTLKNLGIIDEGTYKLWIRRPKEWVVRNIGLHLGKEMAKMNDIMRDAINSFIEVNEIPDHEIISKKRDAIFIFNTPITKVEVAGFTFVKKNQYSSYFKFENFEIYYDGGKQKFVIKGLHNEFYEQHLLIPYIIKCIKLFELLDQDFIHYREVFNYIYTLRNEYVNRKLPAGCYREINTDMPFTVYNTIDKTMHKYLIIPKEPQFELVINYNFTRFIIPFISLLSRYKMSAYRK